MSERHYTVVLLPEPEEGGYSVLVPALPGCVTQGETVEECLALAQDAIIGWIATARDFGEPNPEEKEQPQMMVVTVAA